VRGAITATGEDAAFRRLRAAGLSPVRLTPRRSGLRKPVGAGLSERECIELVANLGHLLSAGADMRTALSILGARAAKGTALVCRTLGAEIGGGASLDVCFARVSREHGVFIGAMVSAGEAGGDLAGGLARAAEIIDTRAKLRRKLSATMAYPAFVLASSVAAVVALLLFVIPSLAPLVRDSDAPPPVSLRLMLMASDALQAHLFAVELALVLTIAGLLFSHRSGLLGRFTDRLLLTGPTRRTAAGIAFGSFAVVLGGMLTAGTPMSDALRLSLRSVRSSLARERLDPIVQQVREGQSLSRALEDVRGFPEAIWSLTAVGEASGSLGPMLVRSGKLEEEASLGRIEAVGQLLGPALIIALGGLVGLLMAGLLSGVSQLGQSTLG
jgi:type II secretory pathway component PulF